MLFLIGLMAVIAIVSLTISLMVACQIARATFKLFISLFIILVGFAFIPGFGILFIIGLAIWASSRYYNRREVKE